MRKAEDATGLSTAADGIKPSSRRRGCHGSSGASNAIRVQTMLCPCSRLDLFSANADDLTDFKEFPMFVRKEDGNYFLHGCICLSIYLFIWGRVSVSSAKAVKNGSAFEFTPKRFCKHPCSVQVGDAHRLTPLSRALRGAVRCGTAQDGAGQRGAERLS